MKCPIRSGLAQFIDAAVEDCFFHGGTNIDCGYGISISAEWVESRNKGYAVIRLTFLESDVVAFSYDDYSTEYSIW